MLSGASESFLGEEEGKRSPQIRQINQIAGRSASEIFLAPNRARVAICRSSAQLSDVNS